jgi:hypothetical protein
MTAKGRSEQDGGRRQSRMAKSDDGGDTKLKAIRPPEGGRYKGKTRAGDAGDVKRSAAEPDPDGGVVCPRQRGVFLLGAFPG